MNRKQKRWLKRILIALAAFFVIMATDELGALRTLFGERGGLYASFLLYLIPYLIAGHDVLAKAARNIRRGHVFDENFLMSIATVGAFAMVAFPDAEPHMAEGAAVMLFYQVGELFQSYALGRSRKSIADLMDIAPDVANLEVDGELVETDPAQIAPGSIILVKPGERVPLDGVIVEGESRLDTAALTGESIPRRAADGDEVISGCINMTAPLRIRTTKPFGESTVSRILELVENASEKKARTENFITRFARVYTPVVCASALAIAILPPLIGAGSFSDWLLRGLTFLVVSCPCALVISVPLSFFGGIGAAARCGILIKGSNYLEALSHVQTVVFDKTGTLTRGSFSVVDAHAEDGNRERLVEIAALAESYSDHPIALSVKSAYGKPVDRSRVSHASETAGRGVAAFVDGKKVLVGNVKLMEENGVVGTERALGGNGRNGSATMLYVAEDGVYRGSIAIADTVKPDAARAIAELHDAGAKRCIMLSGDRTEVARQVAAELGLDGFKAQLLPQDKVAQLERIMAESEGEEDREAPAPGSERNGARGQGAAEGRKRANVAFVGDGINDAPVLARADVGIAMGALGSDAAIEAADVVLMNDRPSDIARSIRIARKTMGIVRQNIVFAIGVKVLILVLAALGMANMWLAVFGDVGVAVLAILNAMRAMRA